MVPKNIMTKQSEIKSSDHEMEQNLKPRIREHEAFVADTRGEETLSDALLFKWSREKHSVAGHLLFLYALAKGLDAKRILEVGFGRSTKVMARVAVENDGRLTCCDKNDLSYLLSDTEREHVEFVNGRSDVVWRSFRESGYKIDMAFLDYFSSKDLPMIFVLKEVLQCLSALRKDGFLCVHDVCDPRYPVKMLPSVIGCIARVERLVLPYNQGLLVVRKVSSGLSIPGLGLSIAFRLVYRIRGLLRR
jgi:predicted O-methyltransferase YrrM